MSSFILQDFHNEKKNTHPKNATGLRIVRHHTIKDAVDAVDQNNSTFNSTTCEHQFDKTCYNSIYFLCLICLVGLIPVYYKFVYYKYMQ